MERLTERYTDGTAFIPNVVLQLKGMDGVAKKLAEYEDLEEQCIAENQCGIGELLLKWKAFFDDIAELYDYRKAEEQGLLLRNPKDLENAILDRMQEFMEEWRSYSESSVDHFGGKADAMEVAQKIVKGAFKSYLEEAEAALAEKGAENERDTF